MQGWFDVFRLERGWERYWGVFTKAELSFFTRRGAAAAARVAHICLDDVEVGASVVKRGPLQIRYTISLHQGGAEVLLGVKDPEERARFQNYLLKECGCRPVPGASSRRGSKGTRSTASPRPSPRQSPEGTHPTPSASRPPQPRRLSPSKPYRSAGAAPMPMPPPSTAAKSERSEGSTVPAAPSPEVKPAPEPTFADALRALQSIPQLQSAAAALDDIDTTSAESPPSPASSRGRSRPRGELRHAPVAPLPLPIPAQREPDTHANGDADAAVCMLSVPAPLAEEAPPVPAVVVAEPPHEASPPHNDRAAASMTLPLPSPVPSPITPACAVRSPSQGRAGEAPGGRAAPPPAKGGGAADPSALLDLIYHYKQILRGKLARANIVNLHEAETNALLELLKDYRRVLGGTVTRPDLVALLEKQSSFDAAFSSGGRADAPPGGDAHAKAVEVLEKQRDEDARAIETLRAELAGVERQRDAAQTARMATEKERAAAVDREEALKRELEAAASHASLEEKCLHLEAENAMLRTEAHDYEAQLTRLRSGGGSEASAARSRSRSRHTDREPSSEPANGELTLAEQRARHLEDTVTALEATVRGKEARVASLERDMQDLKKVDTRPPVSAATHESRAVGQRILELERESHAKSQCIDSLREEVASLRAAVDKQAGRGGEREWRSVLKGQEAEITVLKELLQTKEAELLRVARHGDTAREARQLLTARVEKDLVFLRTLLETEGVQIPAGASRTAVHEAQQVCQAVEADVCSVKELLVILGGGSPTAARPPPPQPQPPAAQNGTDGHGGWSPRSVGTGHSSAYPERSCTAASSQALEEENRTLRAELARLRIVNEAWSEHSDIEPRPSQPPQPSSPPSSRSTSHSRCLSPNRGRTTSPRPARVVPRSQTADTTEARYVLCHVCGEHFANGIALHLPACLKAWRAAQKHIPEACRHLRPPPAPTAPVADLTEYNRQAQHIYLTMSKNRCPYCLQRFDASVIVGHLASCSARARQANAH